MIPYLLALISRSSKRSALLAHTASSSTVLLVLLFLIPLGMKAHGGEDHGDAASSTPPATVGDALFEGSSSRLEIVVKGNRPEPGHPTTLRFFIADYATNRPESGTSFVVASQPKGVRAIGAPHMIAPGIYETTLLFPADIAYSLSITAALDDGSDRIEMKALAPAKAIPPEPTSSGGWWIPALIAVGVAGLLLAVVLLRRRAPKPLLPGVVGLIVGSSLLIAHGGEDHGSEGAASPPASASGSIVISKEAQFATGMLTELTSPDTVNDAVATNGHVVPRTDAQADVLPPMPGKIVGGRLPALGERVRRGETLVRIASIVPPAERAALEGERARTRAELQTADREVERLARLDGVVAGKLLIEARIRRDAARGALASIESRLNGRGSVDLPAPISGTIVEARAVSGSVVDGSTPLYRIADLSRIWIEADLFDRDVARVQRGQSVRVAASAWPGEVFIGRVLRIGGEIDAEARTGSAIVEVENSSDHLRLNMPVTLAIATGTTRTGIVVPTEAVVRSGGRAFVFVHTHAEQFDLREVTPGTSGLDRVEIIQGLAGGERVLTVGAYQLKGKGGL